MGEVETINQAQSDVFSPITAKSLRMKVGAWHTLHSDCIKTKIGSFHFTHHTTHQALSLVDVFENIDEKCSQSRDDDEAQAGGATANVLNRDHEMHAEVELVQDIGNGRVVNEHTQDSTNDELVNEVKYSEDARIFQVQDKIICDESSFQQLQNAKFQLGGILGRFKFDRVAVTVDKLRSIFNCHGSDPQDFRNMFVDERHPSFEYDERTMLLAMRGWMITNAHCHRCRNSFMVLRPGDGDLMCPECDNVEPGLAETFPLNPNHEPSLKHDHVDPGINNESPRLKARIHGVPSQLNKWTTLDRVCLHCSKQLMRNPNLETDHCPTCGPVLPSEDTRKPTDSEPSTDLVNQIATGTSPVHTTPAQPAIIDASNIQQAPIQTPPLCEETAQAEIEYNTDAHENDVLDATMLKELKEAMKQIQEAKDFLTSRRTPRTLPASNNNLQLVSPATTNMSSARAGILKSSGYHTPQLNSGYRTPHLPGKYFFA